MSLITIPYQNSIMDPGPNFFYININLKTLLTYINHVLNGNYAVRSIVRKLWPKKTTLKKCCVYFMLLLLPVVQKSIN